jgi:hypothetical protein
LVDGAVLINLSVIRMNWLASKHNLKMAGQSFGWKKNYGLTVTVSSPEPLLLSEKVRQFTCSDVLWFVPSREECDL